MTATQSRRDAVLATLPEAVDALLVTAPVNIRYLTGFTGSSGALLLGRDGEPALATDGRYLLQAAAEAPDVVLVDSRAPAAALAAHAADAGGRRLGIEQEHMTLGAFSRLADAGALELTPLGALVERQRMVKDATEVATLQRACAITDAALDALLPWLRPGLTEREVARRLEHELVDREAEGPAFDTIVAAGPHSAVPHHQPTDRQLARGDLLKLDFGARYGGYHADMTRTLVLGEPAAWQRELHDLVREVQASCRAATRTGADPRALDTMARQQIEAAGHSAAHGLGHGVGLQIHEAPFLTAESTASALAGQEVVTVEPGVYLAGQGGVRIEDCVVVGDREPRLLTVSTRDLVQVG